MREMAGKEEAVRWLGLSAAARFIGVHPTTLREWADRGLIAHTRTLGRHRRFALDDLRAFVAAATRPGTMLLAMETQTNAIASRAIEQIHREPLGGMAWYGALSPQDVERKREQGRRLLGLALQFVSRQSGRDMVLSEAGRIGHEYGCDAVTQGLSLPETVRAFSFFRDSLVRAARPSESHLARFDDEDMRIYHDLHTFLDAVFYTMLAAFEDCQRQARTGLLSNGQR